MAFAIAVRLLTQQAPADTLSTVLILSVSAPLWFLAQPRASDRTSFRRAFTSILMLRDQRRHSKAKIADAEENRRPHDATGGAATQAGLDILKEGSAADAAMATALCEVTHAGG